MSDAKTDVGRSTTLWWARLRKLCALERPGGGGKSHRAERRAAEIDWLRRRGVRLLVSTMRTRHNLPEYEAAGLEWHHVPVASCAEDAKALDELLPLLRAELRTRGAVAVHGDQRTNFVAALCAAHLHEVRGIDPAVGLCAAARAGLEADRDSAALLGVPYQDVAGFAAVGDRA